jgi:hypothetical protein
LPLRLMARRAMVPLEWLRGEAEANRVPHLRAGRQFLFHPETVERVLVERASVTTRLQACREEVR